MVNWSLADSINFRKPEILAFFASFAVKNLFVFRNLSFRCSKFPRRVFESNEPEICRHSVRENPP
jgi:hypothetical protein